MKKLLTYILLGITLIGSLKLPVNVHLCHSEMVAVSTLLNPETCNDLGSCHPTANSMQTTFEKGCCEDLILQFSLEAISLAEHNQKLTALNDLVVAQVDTLLISSPQHATNACFYHVGFKIFKQLKRYLLEHKLLYYS